MLIDEVITFCDEEYKKENNKQMPEYRFCRYSYRYCSEYIYALRAINLNKYPCFNILSLGCGTAADLMAFEYMGYDKRIWYNGMDNNHGWRKIHERIGDIFTGGVAEFHRGIDVLTYFQSNVLGDYNVLVIPYYISLIYEEIGETGLRNWFSALAWNVVRYKLRNSPMLIIINDVDAVYEGRDVFSLLTEEIANADLEISFELRRQFKDIDNNGYKKAPAKRNIFEVPNEFIEKYSVSMSCESVQLILEVV